MQAPIETSSIALAALALWPIVAFWLFVTRPLAAAILWTILGAQLLLPVGARIKFEMVPLFDKISIPNLCIFIGCVFLARKKRYSSKFWLVWCLTLCFVLGPVFTSLQNGDPIQFARGALPGVGLYDAGSAVQLALIVLIPFFVGRRFFRTEQDIKLVLQCLVVAMSIYSILFLFEVRFSPQLHNWVYGYLPSEFIQSVRGGNYRPMAFMGHGLIAAHFVLIALLAAVALSRANAKVWTVSARPVSAYLGVILFFCRTLSATAYAVTLAPIMIFTSAKMQVRLAIILTILALLYPMLRVLDLFPTKILTETAALSSEERAASLKYRFYNEDKLLAHAFERPWFGWGRYGRNRVYDEVTGSDDSVTDGEWIITIGQFGLIGFIAKFGLLSLGVLRVGSALRFAASPQDQIYLAALSLIVAVNILDLLPNSGLFPWTWFLSGCLLGRVDALKVSAATKMEGVRSLTLTDSRPAPMPG